ncbi:hypothetical protein BN903_104 [Halorubrum sp. AJ67]|nr:hypothetical protein BN903_104 [Halorubrum sp. AJ67]
MLWWSNTVVASVSVAASVRSFIYLRCCRSNQQVCTRSHSAG